MLINTIIIVLASVCIIRTVSYGVWNFRNKNIVGGISVLVLALLAALSVIFVI